MHIGLLLSKIYFWDFPKKNKKWMRKKQKHIKVNAFKGELEYVLYGLSTTLQYNIAFFGL